MTWTSTLPKGRVRRVWLWGGWTWEASRPGGVYLVGYGLHFYTWESAIAHATARPEWRCPRCGSDRWVAVSLTGPVEHGGKAIKQCVPCGYYSGTPVTPAPRGER